MSPEVQIILNELRELKQDNNLLKQSLGIGIEPKDNNKRVIDEAWNCERIIKKFNKRKLKK
jgi:hypothetical protein